jgi:F0F1-type ATP synthase delta subunit
MKATQYAEAIFQASRNKSDVALEVLANNVRALLEKKGYRSLLPAIVRELEKLTLTRGAADECVIRVAKESDTVTFTTSIQKDIQTLNAEALPTRVVVDDTVIGGYEVRAKGVRIDQTYKRSLLTLYTNLLTNNA